jgi:hypothetical protein
MERRQDTGSLSINDFDGKFAVGNTRNISENGSSGKRLAIEPFGLKRIEPRMMMWHIPLVSNPPL